MKTGLNICSCSFLVSGLLPVHRGLPHCVSCWTTLTENLPSSAQTSPALQPGRVLVALPPGHCSKSSTYSATSRHATPVLPWHTNQTGLLALPSAQPCITALPWLRLLSAQLCQPRFYPSFEMELKAIPDSLGQGVSPLKSLSTPSMLLVFEVLSFAQQSSPSSIGQVCGSQDPRSWLFSPFSITENLLCAETVL